MARLVSKLLCGMALAAFAGGSPLLAQSTNNVAASVPPATTSPAPAPSGNSVGPPQLRDFSLKGTVTRPAETTAPAPTPSRAPAAVPDRPPEPRPARRESSIADTPAAPPAAVRRAPAAAVTADRDITPPPVANPLADATPAQPPQPSFDQPAPEPISPVPPAVTDTGRWPWLAALLALVLGGGFLLWRRQQARPARLAAGVERGAAAAPRDVSPTSPERAPPGTAPAPRRAPWVPAPAPTPAPAPAPAPSAAPLGIVASGLRPQVEFDLVPLRVDVDAGGGAAVTVEVILINRGGAPARDVLVQAELINAGPQADSEVGQFFLRPAGPGDRIALVKPMGSVSVQMRLAVTAAQLAPLVIDGRKLLVPLVAVSAFYRWNGGELGEGASFLLGRGAAEAAKLAPFRLDLGARSWSTLAARRHSNGLQR